MTPTDEIKDRLDLVETVQGYVRLQKAGKNWKGLCPFHNEKTASFFVSPEKEMWYCFGCGEGGDLFTFIEKIEGVEFSDALRMLADKAGIELKREDPKIRSQRQEVYEIVELAAKFYEKQLHESAIGKKSVEYLKKRGLKDATISEWRLGYAPDTWRALHEFLSGKGYSDKTIELAGLSVESASSPRKSVSWHDRFRHRIMFPIFDIQGNPVGFAGRVFDEIPGKTVGEEAGKYINTPNTVIYDKSGILYGLDRAKMAIKKEERAVLVEGNLDVIMTHQAGTQNVVASSGTALTSRHLRLIKRYTNEIILSFDADEAGERAVHKGASLAGSMGLGVSVVALPPGQDAADVASAEGPQWQKALDARRPYVRFTLERALEKHNPKTLEGKKDISREVLGAILTLQSPLEREHWLAELALAVKVAESTLNEELTILKKISALSASSSAELPRPPEKKIELEEYLLALLVIYPRGVKEIAAQPDIIESEEVKAAIAGANRQKGDISGFLKNDSRLLPVLARAVFLEELIGDKKEEFAIVLGTLKRRSVKEKLQSITADLKKAEQDEDGVRVKTLLGEFSSLSKELLSHEQEEKN